MTKPDTTTAPQRPTVLRIDASARREGSVSRQLADTLMEQLQAQHGDLPIIHRDLAVNPPAFVDEDWVAANFTAPESRNREQRATLAASDALVDELKAADLLVIGVPLYNFGVPAALKAWVDMIARAHLTFRYTDRGPEGLLRNKRAYLLFASGGVPAGSEVEFATAYMKQVLAFVGIHDVVTIAADRLNLRGDEGINEARKAIDDLFTRQAAPALGAA